MKPLLALLLLAAFSPAYAAPLPHTKVANQISSLVKKHFPAAQIAQDNGSLAAKHNTMLFTIHNRLMNGVIKETPYQAEGPQADGFMLSLSVKNGKYRGQAMVPQTLREPYWQTYFDYPPTPDGHSHYSIHFSFGVNLSPDFKQAVLQEFAKLSPPDRFKKSTPQAKVPELEAIQWQEESRRSTRTLQLHDDGTFNMSYIFRTAEVGQDENGKEKLAINESIKENHSGTWRMLCADHSLLALYSDNSISPKGIRLYRLPSEDPHWRFQSVALRHKSFNRYDQPSQWLEVSPGWHATLRDLARHPAETNALHPLGFKGPLSMRLDVPNEVVNKLAKALPDGWSLQGFENVLLICRDKSVVLKYSMINGPGRAHDDSTTADAVEDWNRSYEGRYIIALRFGQKISQDDHKRLRQRSSDISTKLETISDKLRLNMYKSPSSYLPKTTADKHLYNEYERWQGSLEELPNYYTKQHSIWLSSTADHFASTEVAEECHSVKAKLQSLFHACEGDAE